MPKFFKRRTQPDTDFDTAYPDRTQWHIPGHERAQYLLWCEAALYASAFDLSAWHVPLDRESSSWHFAEVFQALKDGFNSFTPKLSLDQPPSGAVRLRLAGLAVEPKGRKEMVWNNRTYKLKDYKGRQILIPDKRMWGWFQQRQIRVLKLNMGDGDDEVPAVYLRVVFGTKEDKYTHYPEKYGFKGRRAIRHETSWKVADDEASATPANDYETRLRSLNPMRGHFRGKWMMLKSQAALQDRWDEINEESGLRAKHAPCILMINRYVKTYKSFVQTYLSGSQGVPGAPNRARPDHVTDHEIYRMFSGKYRQRILNNALFADDGLVVIKVGKKKNAWWNKDQFRRWLRIRNQN